MPLRPYQQRALEAVRETYRRGHRRALVVMPTGTGKTVLFAEIARLAKGPVLVVAHRQELVEQARDKISRWCDDEVAVEMAERRELSRPTASGRARITVASVQSLQKRLDRVPRDAFRIVVIDEAHHGVADGYRALIEHFDAWLLGVTATPDRADRRPLGDVFSAVAFDYDMQAAIADGWLCPIRSYVVQTDVDFSRVRKIAGELATGEVERELTKEPHLAEIAQPIVRERGDRKTMVFAASVAHAHALCRVLCRLAGDPDFAAAVDGGSPKDWRSATVQRFRDGAIQVLVNCSLFTEGFDVPEVSLVAIARPVLSRAFYAQMVGRGTRLAPDKRDLLVLDFAPGNCRHQLVQAVDIFAGEHPDVVERARAHARQASEEGSPMLLEEVLALARQETEALEADVTYTLRQRDPFAAVGLDVERMLQVPSPTSEGATETQRKYLARAGLGGAQIAQLTLFQAEQLQEALRERKAVGLCSPKQAFELAAYGIDASEMFADAARPLLAWIRKERKARSAAAIRAELARGGGPEVDAHGEAGFPA